MRKINSFFFKYVFAAWSVFFLFGQTSAAEWTVLNKNYGTADYDELGYSIAGLGDVNADGKPDFIAGSPFIDPGGLINAGSVYVYSGATNALLFQKDGMAVGDQLGFSVAGTGDVNGDGIVDFIIGAPFADLGGLADAGSVYLYSGADGSLLYQKNGDAPNDQLGYSVGGAGDVNGDGRTDFIVGAPLAMPGGLDSAGSAYVYSGIDGSLLYQIDGLLADIRLGAAVAGAEDLDGDARADFIIAAPGVFNPFGPDSRGIVYVYSGATGTLLYEKQGDFEDFLGTSVSKVGDINGDGKADFIVGALRMRPGSNSGAGSAFVYSGADGSLLYQKDGATDGDRFGYSVAGAGDANGDGIVDFLVGAPLANPHIADNGSVFLYSGADGSILLQKHGGLLGNVRLGFSVAGVGDLSEDGKADFIIGAPRESYFKQGVDPRNTQSHAVDYGGVALVFRYEPCAADWGDMNADQIYTPSDVVLMSNCVFLGTGSCELCYSDVNCDGSLAASDLVLQLYRVFLALILGSPWCGI